MDNREEPPPERPTPTLEKIPMKRRELLQHMAAAIPALAISPYAGAAGARVPMATGPFEPTWPSLTKYETPDWFRNAKFGIWAHWGPQCEPEHGDWYARGMYEEGSDHYKYHVAKYGHPSKFGFKDVIRRWKAQRWNPDELVGLYKKAGAKYFVALANHHDNFDLYKSRYQPDWNATKLGPGKDLVGGWRDAARKHGLRFGVSVHAAHAWNWYETAQGADKTGPLAGVGVGLNPIRARLSSIRMQSPPSAPRGTPASTRSRSRPVSRTPPPTGTGTPPRGRR